MVDSISTLYLCGRVCLVDGLSIKPEPDLPHGQALKPGIFTF